MNVTFEGQILEEWLHNDIQIPALAKKYNLSRFAVNIVISKYFGTGKFKVKSCYKGRSWKAIKRTYTNITNLDEVYEQERNRCR